MKPGEYLKLVSPNGFYRYGYISKVLDKGYTLEITLFEESDSKIAFDEEEAISIGRPVIDYVSLLTEIEKRIVPLLAKGLDTKEIGVQLNRISPVTVRSHLRTLRIKLHLDDRNQLIAFCEGLNKKLNGE